MPILADVKYITYEKFLNAKIKEYKDAGTKNLMHSINLKVRTIKKYGEHSDNFFAHYDWMDGAAQLRLGPQNAVIEIKSNYNFIKKNEIGLPDAEIMNTAVSQVFNSLKKMYGTFQNDNGQGDVGTYYSACVLRDLLSEVEVELGRLACADNIEKFIVSKNSSVEVAKAKYKKFWLGIDRASEREKNGDDTARLVGSSIGLVIVLIIVVGFFKIVSGIVSSSSYSGSGYSSQSSGGSMTINGESYTRQQFEDKLRSEAETLYDNCQVFGRSFSDKCP